MREWSKCWTLAGMILVLLALPPTSHASPVTFEVTATVRVDSSWCPRGGVDDLDIYGYYASVSGTPSPHTESPISQYDNFSTLYAGGPWLRRMEAEADVNSGQVRDYLAGNSCSDSGVWFIGFPAYWHWSQFDADGDGIPDWWDDNLMVDADKDLNMTQQGTTDIPLPSSFLLLGSGLMCLAGLGRRRLSNLEAGVGGAGESIQVKAGAQASRVCHR